MEDVSGFHEERYFPGKIQQHLYDTILTGTKITEKLLHYGIPYRNSTLVYGAPGTGKTQFAKYVAYKLNIPYAYINFSYLIRSYLGETARNIQKVFDYCKGMKCVLMLDEIDCIGMRRSRGSGSGGPEAELNRTTISLMQCLDELASEQVIIAATNRKDQLDEALLRRFKNKEEFYIYDQVEELAMIQKFVDSIDIMELDQDLIDYATQNHTQADTIDYLTESLIQKILALPD